MENSKDTISFTFWLQQEKTHGAEHGSIHPPTTGLRKHKKEEMQGQGTRLPHSSPRSATAT